MHPFCQFIEKNEGRVTVKTINFLLVILFSLAVAACGGGGGGDSTPTPTYSISGTVTGTTAVTITVSGGTANTVATTDTTDNYTVTGLNNGSYTVTPSKPGYTFTPPSSSVAITGANKTVENFAVVKNSVLANISGTVSGTWVEGVTITISGDERRVITTEATGSYNFGKLASGASYTFTPALAGYTFSPASQTVTVAAGEHAAVKVPDMVASPVIASYSISGTVSYTGTMPAGPIAIRVIPCTGCSPVLGTTIATAGPYTLRGLQSGTYTLVAEMDTLGTGIPNATNPSGSSIPVTISVANPNPTVDVTVDDPATVPDPGIPNLLSVAPGNGSAFVMYRPLKNMIGQEYVTSYKIYWGTDTDALTGGDSVTFAAQGDRTNFYVLNGLANNAVFYFRMSSFVGAVQSALSPPSAPVTIGATSGFNTVSGAVTFPVAFTGPMIVGLYGSAAGSGTPSVYFNRIESPVSPQPYSIAGVAAGSYFPFALIDTNGNGVIDSGEISNISNNIDGLGRLITVAGTNITGNDIALSEASATASVNTEHYWDSTWHSYRLMLGVNDGIKRAVAVTLFSGPNVAVPLDMSANRVVTLDPNIRPNTGDNYRFKVTFSDGTSENISASVSGVLDSFAQSLLVIPTPFAVTPTFSWAAPSPLPSTPYIYRLVLWGDTDQISWRYPQDFGLPSTTLSMPYSGTNLNSGNSYQWAVQVRDANGNSASRPSNFTVH